MHGEFYSGTGRVKWFNRDGTLWAEGDMGDQAVNGPGFGFRGRCPRGTYRLGPPVEVHDESMGYWFTPLLAVPDRDGIGMHGGGSALGVPGAFAPEQPLLKTLGCLRVRNADNRDWALEIAARQAAGEACFLTVSGP